MNRVVTESRNCARCGQEKFDQERFVVSGAQTQFQVLSNLDPMGKWHTILDDVEIWQFPLCAGCLKKAFKFSLEFEDERTQRNLVIFGVCFAASLIAAFLVIDPRPHPWGLLEVVIALLVFCSPIFFALNVIAKVGIMKRLKRLDRGVDVQPEEYDRAFSGEAESILRHRRGRAAGLVFPLPQFGEIPAEKLRDASNLTREFKVLSVGRTLGEAASRVPEPWKKHLDRFDLSERG